MYKEFLLTTYVIAICYAAVIKDLQPEIKSDIPENGIDEVGDNGSSDLDTAETKHFGFGPKILVVNKGIGGHGGGYGGGYGKGYGGGCGCGSSSHYHRHYSYYG